MIIFFRKKYFHFISNNIKKTANVLTINIFYFFYTNIFGSYNIFFLHLHGKNLPLFLITKRELSVKKYFFSTS